MALSKKHKTVIDYMIAFGCSGAKAYSKYYQDCTPESARTGAHRLFTNVDAKEYYENEQKRLAKKLNTTKEDNLKWLIQARDADILEAFDQNKEGFKSIEDIPPILRKITNEIEKVDGKFKVKLPSKLQCVKVINDMLGYNSATKFEVETKVETVVTGKVFTIDDLKKTLGEIKEKPE